MESPNTLNEDVRTNEFRRKTSQDMTSTSLEKYDPLLREILDKEGVTSNDQFLVIAYARGSWCRKFRSHTMCGCD